MDNLATPPTTNNTPPAPPQLPVQAQPVKSKTSGCLKGCLVAAGVFFLVLVLGCVIASCAGSAFVNSVAGSMGSGGYGEWDMEHGSDEFPPLVARWSSGDGDTPVVRVPLHGIILFGGGRFGRTGSADLALASIRRATLDPEVKGLLVELDSPGGGITASDVIYKAILDFKAYDSTRKVVVLMNDIAASGAYYIACAADEIIAHPTTLTGSIGVIMKSYNIHGLAEKIGLTDVTVKSGANKDLMNALQPVNQDRLDTLLQPVVDRMHARFVSIICKGRNLAEADVTPLADGRLLDADTALAAKFVDAIGYRGDSEIRIANLLGLASVKVIRYEEEAGLAALFRKTFLSMDGGGNTVREVKQLLHPPETRFMYLWQW